MSFKPPQQKTCHFGHPNCTVHPATSQLSDIGQILQTVLEIKEIVKTIQEELSYIDDDSSWQESEEEEEDADDDLSDPE